MADPQVKVRFSGDASGLEQASRRASDALGKVQKSAGNSSQAMINFGRVIQDAPYGIQGVANNIDPLIQSLGGSAGLSIVTSLATSALVLFGKELFKSSNATFRAKEDLKEFTNVFGYNAKNVEQARKQLEEYHTMVSSVVEKNAEELGKVSALVDRFKESNTTRSEQIGIIKQLQKLAPDYFGKLDAESAKVRDVTTAYQLYNNEIVKTIETQIRLAELNDLIKDRLDFSRQNKDATEFINNLLASGKSLDEISKIISENFRLSNEAAQKFYNSNKFVTAEQEKQFLLQSAKIPLGVEILVQKLRKEQSILDEINNAKQKTLGFTTQEIAEEEKLRHARIFSLEELKKIQELHDIINGKLPQKKTAFTPTGQITSSLQLPGSSKEDEEKLKRTKAMLESFGKLAEKVGQQIVKGLGGAFTELFENILSGGKNAFQVFAQALGNIIKRLIATALAAAVLSAIISTIPGFGGAFGIDKVTSFGKSFKAVFSGLAGFEEGGIARGPRSGYPVMLHGTEAVVPFDKMDQFINMVGKPSGETVIEHRITGDELVVLINRTEARRGRLG